MITFLTHWPGATEVVAVCVCVYICVSVLSPDEGLVQNGIMLLQLEVHFLLSVPLDNVEQRTLAECSGDVLTPCR